MTTRDCPHGQLTRACDLCERDAEIAALRERLAAAEALSESRRVTLLAKSEELAAEWKRAETAEAKVAAAHAAGERSGIERAAALFSYSTDQCATDRLCMHRQELCSCEAVSNAIRALLPAAVAEPEPSGISGELPAEPAAKCATCGGTGKVITMHYDEDESAEYDPCPSCGGAR